MSVTLPSSVTSIGNSAFYCASLKELVLSENITDIGTDAFYKIPTCKNDYTYSTITASVDMSCISGASYNIKLLKGYSTTYWGINYSEFAKSTNKKLYVDNLSSDVPYRIDYYLILPNSYSYKFDSRSFSTKRIIGYLTMTEETPTSIKMKAYYEKGNAIEEVRDTITNIKYSRVEQDGNTYTFYGLKPSTTYSPIYHLYLSDDREYSA